MVGTNAPSAQASSAQHVGGARTSVPRRRVTAGGGASSAAGQRSRGVPASSQGILRFYTDDTPGLKVGPQTVLILTLCFMASVVLLHIVGKVHQTYGGES